MADAPAGAQPPPPVASAAGTARQRGARKVVKWLVFTAGLVAATALADWTTIQISGGHATAQRLFGTGELFLVSIGLLIGAAADLTFDCFLVQRARLYHGIVMAFCWMAALPIAVAYGAARGNVARSQATTRPAVEALAAAAAAEGEVVRYSLWSFAGAFVLSIVGVWLSEQGGPSDP